MKSIFVKLKQALIKTSNKIGEGIDNILFKKKLDENSLNDLEDLLVMSDIGQEVSKEIINTIKKHKFDKEVSAQEIKEDVANTIMQILVQQDHDFIIEKDCLNVIIVCGVNGNGKTTTIGKLASQFSQQGQKIAIAACDTFRAAAVAQLEEWATRSGADFICGEAGSDPASVAYKAVESSLEKNVDILFVDTAGRLHNHNNLMQELEKIVKVTKKIQGKIKHHHILVLDGTTGQNAVIQAKEFKKIADISGIVITKLDGTAKAGAIIEIVRQCNLPIYFIGIGEQIDDIKIFNPKDFAYALVGLEL